MKKLLIIPILIFLLVLSGCTTVHTSRTVNGRGMATRYEDPSSTGQIGGIGVESQDIVSMTDKMMRDMMANSSLAGRATPPRVVIDSKYFRNESSSIINKNMITETTAIFFTTKDIILSRMTLVSVPDESVGSTLQDLRRVGGWGGQTDRN